MCFNWIIMMKKRVHHFKLCQNLALKQWYIQFKSRKIVFFFRLLLHFKRLPFSKRMTTTLWMFFSDIWLMFPNLFQLSPSSSIFFTIDFICCFVLCSSISFYSTACARSLSISLSNFLETALNSFAKWIAMHRMCGILNSKSIIWSFVHALCCVIDTCIMQALD